MVVNEDFKETLDWATRVARSIVDRYQNTSDSSSPTLDVMIADALMRARAEGWQSAFFRCGDCQRMRRIWQIGA